MELSYRRGLSESCLKTGKPLGRYSLPFSLLSKSNNNKYWRLVLHPLYPLLTNVKSNYIFNVGIPYKVLWF